MEKNKNKTNWVNITVWLMICLGIFFGGMVVGMGFQQRIMFIGFGEALSYADIEVNVDINETMIVDRTMDRMIPFLNESMNLNKSDKLNITKESK